MACDAGDQHGNIRVWDLTASACSCELVPEVGTAVRSLTVALNGSLVVAANNAGTCYVWRMLRGASLATHFEPLHKLRAHAGAGSDECTMYDIYIDTYMTVQSTIYQQSIC